MERQTQTKGVFMTNEKCVEELIQTAKKIGENQRVSGWTELKNQLAIDKSAVLARMRPDEEILPGVEGKDVVLEPPPFNPENLPGGVVPPEAEFSTKFHDDIGL